MDENTFFPPVPEDNELPAPAPAPREDNDLPGEAYIDNAAALFNFTGEPAPARDRPAPATRLAGDTPAAPPAFPGDGSAPTPPWLAPQTEERPAVSAAAGVVPAPAPDAALMPEEPQEPRADRQKLYKKLALILAAAAVALAGVLTLLLFRFGLLPVRGNTASVVYEQPRTTAEIAGFYKTAVEIAEKEGAGYRKKAWQTISDMNLTGIAFVDGVLSGVFEEYFTPESAAKTEKYEKGSAEAKQNLPAFTLKDTSYLKSAECVRVGNSYQITLVFQHEDTPRGSDSFLAKATDTVFLWDKQIEPILAEISQLKDYENVHVDYVDVTVAAEISDTGRFISMTHTAPAEVNVGSARISIFTFSDKTFRFESVAEYRDFVY
ncbi:MAG: hypothetical protein IJK89_08455 [Clostridia bacterium]|nr:hypothetical protein [Clostridia bacterium]